MRVSLGGWGGRMSVLFEDAEIDMQKGVLAATAMLMYMSNFSTRGVAPHGV